jgi:DNA invertase Pin-like site-specific DNA recombinase
MKKIVAYYRVSTDQQGRSGLGLEGQRAIVEDYAEAKGALIAGEFTDIMSGRSQDRPELAKALAKARAIGATLVVAKLDRLARNARFLSELVDGDVDVVFCNLPDLPPGAVGRFMVQVMASIAELESGMISDRTKSALQAAKARGVKLGGDRGATITAEMRKKSEELRRAKCEAFAVQAQGRIEEIVEQGVSSRSEIARRLNQEGFKTPSGRGNWSVTMVSRVMARLNAKSHREAEEAKARLKELQVLTAFRGKTGPRGATGFVRVRA